jgi:hypothetical protein
MYWLVLAVSALVLLVTVWILIPAPNALLLPLAVGAPELSPVLLAVALVIAAVASLYARPLGIARLALVFALVSAIISLWPSIQLPSALRRFEEAASGLRGTASHGSPVSIARLKLTSSEVCSSRHRTEFRSGSISTSRPRLDGSLSSCRCTAAPGNAALRRTTNGLPDISRHVAMWSPPSTTVTHPNGSGPPSEMTCRAR